LNRNGDKILLAMARVVVNKINEKISQEDKHNLQRVSIVERDRIFNTAYRSLLVELGSDLVTRRVGDIMYRTLYDDINRLRGERRHYRRREPRQRL